MKTLAKSHHKFYYVAYCFCHSRRFNLREKQNNVFVVSMFIRILKRILSFLLKPLLRLQMLSYCHYFLLLLHSDSCWWYGGSSSKSVISIINIYFLPMTPGDVHL